MKTNTKELTQIYKQSENEKLFAIVKQKEKFIIVCGNYKVSNEEFENIEEAEEYIKSKPYELIINVTTLIAKFELEKLNNTKNEKD